MKRIICKGLIIVTLVFMIGCKDTSEKKEDSQKVSVNAIQDAGGEKETKSSEEIDVDLTELDSIMLYSEVYNILMSPDSYVGKNIKMTGTFGVYQDESTKKNYFACLVSDETNCCTQGLEFVLEGERSYPEDYPEIGTQITVVGTMDVYEEEGYKYCQLMNARLIES